MDFFDITLQGLDFDLTFVPFSGALRGNVRDGAEAPQAAQLRPELRRKGQRAAVLPLQLLRGLCGDRSGLYCGPQALRRAHVLGRVPLHDAPKVPAHAPAENVAAQHGGAVLRPPQDVPHLHALLRRQTQPGAQQPARHGRGPVRMLIMIMYSR